MPDPASGRDGGRSAPDDGLTRARVLLLDDHTTFRESLVFVLGREPDLEVVAQAGTLAGARALLVAGARVDVAVLDAGLPDGDGMDLIEDLRAANPEALSLVLTASLDPWVHALAVEAGASGVLHKSSRIGDKKLVVNAADGVLRGYADPGGDPFIAELVSGTANGALELAEDGSFEYVPRKDFNGTDSFTYEVCDAAGACSDPAKAEISVTPVDEPSPQPPANAAPKAMADAYAAKAGSRLAVRAPDVLENDADPDGDRLTASLVLKPKPGRLTVKPDGSFVYTPAKNFKGTDSFTYRASDGRGGTSDARVKITIRSTPPAPRPPGTVRCTIVGTPGDDVLRGTPGSDAICGGRGNDTIYGFASSDTLIGGPGNDRLYGGSGNDTVIGGPGRDEVVGGPGKDVETG